MPCADCATKNGFLSWEKDAGSFHGGLLMLNMPHMYNIYYIRDMTSWCEKAKRNDKCIQEMIQNLPYEVFDAELINYSGCLNVRIVNNFNLII